MIGFLKKILRFKSQELEATLRPTAACSYGGVGEVELEWYSDGRVCAELTLKHAGIPDGSTVEFYCDGRRVGVAVMQGSFARGYETLDAAAFTVKSGAVAEIRLDGVVLYTGQFRPD